MRGATLSPDGKTVTLDLEGFGPTWGMEVVYTFQGIDGKTFTGKLHNTVQEKAAAGRGEPAAHGCSPTSVGTCGRQVLREKKLPGKEDTATEPGKR